MLLESGFGRAGIVLEWRWECVGIMLECFGAVWRSVWVDVGLVGHWIVVVFSLVCEAGNRVVILAGSCLGSW